MLDYQVSPVPPPRGGKAEGCFNVSITSNARYALGNVIKMRYILDQKDNAILTTIQNLFGFGKVTLRSNYKKKKKEE